MSNKTEQLKNIFNQIFVLVQQEAHMLDKDEIDTLSAITAQRESLMAEVWQSRNEYDEAILMDFLQQLQKAQEELIMKAQSEHSAVRQQLMTRKKQGRYFSNAQKRITYSDKAFYMNKIS